jgi:hypothetical protein
VLVSVSGNAGFTATMLLATVHGQNDDPNAQVTESHTGTKKTPLLGDVFVTSHRSSAETKIKG